MLETEQFFKVTTLRFLMGNCQAGSYKRSPIRVMDSVLTEQIRHLSELQSKTEAVSVGHRCAEQMDFKQYVNEL